MKPGPFITLFALLARVDEKTLAVHARALRDAGVLDKGGRGRSAIEVDHVYFAKLLTSRMATDRPANAVEAFHRFSGMQLSNVDKHGWVKSVLPDPDHKLIDFMTAICDPANRLPDRSDFEVSFDGAAMATVRTDKAVLSYVDRDWVEGRVNALGAAGNNAAVQSVLSEAAASQNSMLGIVESRSFTSTWLQAVKDIAFPIGPGK